MRTQEEIIEEMKGLSAKYQADVHILIAAKKEEYDLEFKALQEELKATR